MISLRVLFRTVLVIASVFSASEAQQLPSAPQPQHAYTPIDSKGRWNWFLDSTVGKETLLVGVFSAGIGTARDAPPEYHGTWLGFAKRYGMRLTGVSTGNAMEAGLGAIWHEDPRYFKATGQSTGQRIKNVVVLTFAAHNREGRRVPAYARYIATPGNNFLSNTWRADSEADTRHALYRTGFGFLGLMGKNAFIEFWPTAKQHLPQPVQEHVPF